MKFTASTVFALLATALSAAPALAQRPFPTILNYDRRYDESSGTLGSTACSADVGPLHGHPTFGSIPSFPRIAGSFVVEGFNSTHCGSCYNLTYVHPDDSVTTLSFTIINQAPAGFISSLTGLQRLTGLPVNEITGDIHVVAQEVPISFCGF